MPHGITITSTTNSDDEIREAAALPLGETGQQLLLEDSGHSEESHMERERSENGNARPPIPRGLSKRFDKVYAQMKSAQEEREQARREAEELRQEIARLRNGNGNGATPHVEAQSAVQEALPEETRQEAQPGPEDHTVKALRQEYGDWDQVFSRAKDARIGDEAAKVLHALPGEIKGHVAYFIAKNPGLREELNKLPPDQQAQAVKDMARDIRGTRKELEATSETIKSPHYVEFSRKIQAMGREVTAEIQRAGRENVLGTRIMFSTLKEINLLPNGVEVARYLLAHPEDCQQFEGMGREQAHLELGRISARLENGNGNGGRPIVSRAPAPISPLRGGSIRSTADLADPELDFQSFKKEREKGSAERRRHGYGI